MTARYSWGADEHLFVEVAEEMSLEAYFRAMAIVTALRERRPEGVLDVCPANASYQVRFDPDALAPDDLLALVQGIETTAPMLARLLEQDWFARGEFHTTTLEAWLA